MSNGCTAVPQPSLGEDCSVQEPQWCKNQEKPSGYFVHGDWRFEEFNWGGKMLAHSECEAYVTNSMFVRGKEVCSNCGLLVPDETEEFFTNLLNLRRL